MAKLTAGYTYTDQELLDLYREAYAQLSVGGQEYYIGSRRFRAADLTHIQEQIRWLETRISAADSGLSLVPVRLKTLRG